MPCIFCIAVGFAVAGAVGASTVDGLIERLKGRAKGPVRKVTDSESVAKVELDVEAEGKQVPVAVTVFKESGRVRIQLLNHALGRPEAEKLQNQLADLLDVRIVERSTEEEEAKVREAERELAERPPTPGAPTAAAAAALVPPGVARSSCERPRSATATAAGLRGGRV